MSAMPAARSSLTAQSSVRAARKRKSALTPKPKLAGETVHAVIPARFAMPGLWVTRTLLLVGVDAQKSVHGMLELTLADDVPPRRAGITCAKDRVTIRTGAKALTYQWDGKALRKR